VLGRPLLADPDYVNKLRRDQVADIRMCLACHDGCLKRVGSGARGSCAINPEAARELIMGIQPAVQKKKVVVVGAGLAGMEAARVCALRGHEVAVYEAEERIGGVVNAGGVPVFKADDRALISWYGRQLEKLGVQLALGTRVTKTFIQEMNPDTVFVATGSKPIIPPVDGIEKDLVSTACDILLGNDEPGDHNVIIGGGLVGCELALHLALNGKKALIVEQLSNVLPAGDVTFMNGQMLKDLLAFHNVELKVLYSLAEVTDSSVVIGKDEVMETIETDRLILACGYKSNNQLFDELKMAVNEAYKIGDSRQVRNIRGAIWDAYEVARSI
jgi:2-enoate reductase